MTKIKTLWASLALAVSSIDVSNASIEPPDLEIAPHVVELPDKLNTVIDTLDNDDDVKYYSFTALQPYAGSRS